MAKNESERLRNLSKTHESNANNERKDRIDKIAQEIKTASHR